MPSPATSEAMILVVFMMRLLLWNVVRLAPDPVPLLRLMMRFGFMPMGFGFRFRCLLRPVPSVCGRLFWLQ